jgi:hypothetical protein
MVRCSSLFAFWGLLTECRWLLLRCALCLCSLIRGQQQAERLALIFEVAHGAVFPALSFR